MQEGRSQFEKKKNSQIKLVLNIAEIIFLERFPHSDKYSWGISYEYLSELSEPTEEEKIRP